MARTDRLMRLMDVLRRLPAPVTSARLAEETGVSRRQLYRDIATLRAGGALIDGAAGLGYTLTEDPALPPQSFSQLEIEALRLAVDALGRIGDAELTGAAHDALARIIATLPERQSRQALHAITRSFTSGPDRAPPSVDLAAIRQACWDEMALEIDYTDLKGAATRRVIWPLGLSYSEQTLMLLAHCRLRMDYRVFHVNRIGALHQTGHSFRPRRVALVRDYAATRRISPPDPCGTGG
ncbi:helix-turn-helix transcriptional regulator [Paracoccus marinaquae]|uniref:YafY family transcriptional regulator n=1 Tax=Paracoccus marinaquae TaxID=2841926 RepID=A0ABS6AMP2_9RHOB|nr:YafY family protein [Paracoccus marinaquae]MBU3030910.1 YafY family transcriptional regulator [Paracoccus marinaquae]